MFDYFTHSLYTILTHNGDATPYKKEVSVFPSPTPNHAILACPEHTATPQKNLPLSAR